VADEEPGSAVLQGELVKDEDPEHGEERQAS
jgi:hypothetical protein